MNSIKSLSLYVHVPFCARKCHYCDFYSVPFSESTADDYADALLIEWELLRKKYDLAAAAVETLYFGGGTPSILSLKHWKKIVGKLVRSLRLAPEAEWSIECNPDSFSPDTALFWLDSGVTRLSLGVQSFNDNELRLLGRVHDARQARELIEHPVLSRFKSVGVDLMYGIPSQTPESLEYSLGKVLDNKTIRHLSAYELTVSEQSEFGRRRPQLALPADEAVAAMTELIMVKTAGAGFDHYEISNFSLPGHACRHNEIYWIHKPYIGLGPAAHSYQPPQRFSNVDSIAGYLGRLRRGELPTGFSETLDVASVAREMVFLGLRTKRGICETDFRLVTGEDFAAARRSSVLAGFVGRGMMEHTPPYWRLTDTGMLFADAIARDLL